MLALWACADPAGMPIVTPPKETGETGDTAPVGPVYPTPCESWAEPVDVGTLADEALNEVSGVEPSESQPGILWMHEDHGGEAAFYALNTAGALLATVNLRGVTNIDMEDMALGPCPDGTCLWMADAGDNLEQRLDYALYTIPEEVVPPEGGLTVGVRATRYPLAYPDGSSENVEAFTLTADGHPLLFTKRGDGVSRVYIADTLTPDVTNTLRYVGWFRTRPADETSGGVVTAADLWPDGSRLLLRAYDRAWQLDLGEAGIEGVHTAPELPIPYADVVHVEALAYDSVARGYWQIPEGVAAPISWVACLD